jgi:hypothetical protein
MVMASLVVRDIDSGRLETLVQALDLDAHLGAQLRVEVGQGSSNRKADGSRTMARPMATRWR